ncbi:MAG TPA: 3'-5' exonuclease, partial [Pseudomonadales bacterium]
LGQLAGQQGCSLHDSLAADALHEALPASAVKPLQGFYQWLQAVRQQCEDTHAIKAVHEMVDDIGYEAWLHQNSSSSAVAEKRMQNVRFLLDNLESSLQRAQEDNDEAGIKDAISRLILRDMLDRQAEEDDDDNRIQLLTLHASKGLEYPHVYMIGMEEELLPHRSSIEQDNIDEERRLAYVGITRAQRTLTLTYAARRRQFGEMVDTTPSRFLDELPGDNLYWPARQDSEEKRQQTAEQTISDLKNLLNGA